MESELEAVGPVQLRGRASSLPGLDSAHHRGWPRAAWFALLGALILLFSTGLVITWVSGPNFQRVPAGPDLPPTPMRICLDVGQVLIPVLALAFFCYFLIRPWLRERRVTFDGLMCIAALTVSMYDPFSLFAQPWFAYNSYLLNFGTPLSEFPGWISLAEPGRTVAWPVPVLPAFYVVSFVIIGILGCSVLNLLKRRSPSLGQVGLFVGVVIIMGLFELLLEGVLFLPMGFWSLAGGSYPITFPGHYFQLPANDFFHVFVVMVAMVYLRHAVNDRGQTIVERGMEQISASPVKQAGVRLLAMVAAIHIITFSLFHIPCIFWSLNSPEWPKDTTDRSYFQNQCGPLMNRACPGPGVPMTRPDSAYLDWSGHVVRPATP